MKTMNFVEDPDYLIAYSQFIDDNRNSKNLILIKDNNDKYGLIFHS